MGISLSGFAQTDSLKVFLKCRNDVSLLYLFKDYLPSECTFKVKGARVIESSQNSEISIMPDSSVVMVGFSRKGKAAGQVLLYSVPPPRPIFELKINGKSLPIMVDSHAGPLPGAVQLSPVADETFTMQVPRDARYKIQKCEVAVVRGDKIISILTFTSPNLDLSNLKSAVKAGDVLHFKVLEMKRQNAVGELIDQPMSQYVISYTIK